MLNAEQAIARTKEMLTWRAAEADGFGAIYLYMRGKQPHPVVPSGVPSEFRRLAKMSRINLVKLALDVPAQSLYIDGYGTSNGSDDDAWAVWQGNKLDARQTAIHRSALGYGVSYTRVTPGVPVPLIKGVSPRNMTTVYSDDDESWPRWALERIVDRTGPVRWRLYDDQAVYFLVETPTGQEVYDVRPHGLGVTPVVRFRNVEDLDDDQVGEVEDLMPLQDQTDKTTFDLLCAQHFQSFRQRYIMGWVPKNEADKLAAGVQRWLTFADPNTQVGEFGQVDLTGYLDSRTAILEYLATLSQTPPHHLLGKLVNLSAEALVAAEVGQRRKVNERETTFGESWEQVFGLAARAQGRRIETGAQVRWRDTEARSLAATVDALGKIVTMLGVPAEELWSRIPGVTQQDVERWMAARPQLPEAPEVPALI